MLACLLVLALACTVAGGALPAADGLVRRLGLRRILAFRSGLLLAVAFADALPEGWRLDRPAASWGALAGFVLGFAFEHFLIADPCHEAAEDCRSHALSVPALAALFVHSLLDGLNLGAMTSAGTAALIAVGASMAVHKVADGFTLTSLLLQAGWTRAQAAWGLGAIALATPLGAVLARLGAANLGPQATAALLGFAGGSFVFIAASELMPRLHRDRDSGSFASFGAGLAAMLALRVLAR